MQKFTQKQILVAIKGSGGIYSQVLYNLKQIYYEKEIKKAKLTEVDKISVFLADKPEAITRQGLHKRISETPKLEKAMEDAHDSIDDLGESAFAHALQRREPWAVKQWLKYKGRTRGYVPAMKMDHTTDDQPLPQAIIYLPKELPYNVVNPNQQQGAKNAQADQQINKEKAESSKQA